MVNATLLTGPDPQAPAEAPVAMNPFVRAADESRQPFADESQQIDTSTHQIGPIDVPAAGYMRNIVLHVTTSGGSGGSAVAHEDAPWNSLSDIKLTDTNGTPLCGPMSGYHLYLVNKWGGLGINQGTRDPASLSSYSAVNATTGQFAFKLRIPVEITSRDGLGSLPNLTSAATYKLSFTVAAQTTIYTTVPATTLPTIRVRAYLENWSQPAAADHLGVPNETAPPAVGTTQFWSESSVNISAGLQNVRFTKMGNHLRNLILVFRNDSSPSVRESSEFPDTDLRLEWDNKILDTWTKDLWVDQMEERFGLTAGTGVFVFDFTHDADGEPGNENRHGWIKTVSGTRFELSGTFGGAGVLTVLTNDISVRGAVQLSSGNPGN